MFDKYLFSFYNLMLINNLFIHLYLIINDFIGISYILKAIIFEF